MSQVLQEVLTANQEYVASFGEKGNLPSTTPPAAGNCLRITLSVNYCLAAWKQPSLMGENGRILVKAQVSVKRALGLVNFWRSGRKCLCRCKTNSQSFTGATNNSHLRLHLRR